VKCSSMVNPEECGPALPPGPHISSPAQTARWLHNPFSFLDACRGRYGDPFTLRIWGWGTLIMASEPELVRQVFRGESEGLHTGQANELMRPLVGDDSVFVVDGHRHREVRRAIVGGLQTGPFRDPALMHRAAARAIARLPAGRVRLHDVMAAITLEVMAASVLGLSPGPTLDRVTTLLRRVLGPLGSVVAFVRPLQDVRAPIGPAYWLRRSIAELDEVIFREVEARRRKPQDNDFISTLLAASQDDAEMTNSNVRDQIVSIIAAGSDTAASAAAWAMYWLHRDGSMVARLLDEISGADPSSAAELEQLRYLDMVINEGLRITPVVELMSRATTRPFEFAGYSLPEGVLVSACSYLTHRDPAIYDDPTTFRPTRFEERSFSSYEFYPFGGGVRRCVGASVAMLEMRVILCTLLKTRRFELLRRDLAPRRRNVTVAPARRTPMTLT
jgi:cytochrome P450